MKRITITLVFTFIFFQLMAQPEEIKLWSGSAPGTLGDTPKDIPTLTLYPAPADKATGSAIVICPGGGYAHLAMDHEGHDVAKWLNSLGISAYILKYRLGKRDGSAYQHPVMLGDAQRAIRTVRANSEKWGLDKNRIGILGFSAGGHLASTAGTKFDNGDPNAKDEIDRENCRPNAMVLIYPVVSFTSKYTHRGSRTHLLGQNPDPKLVENLSNELQVTTLTPPTFMVHSSGDSAVPPENSILFYLALREANVPAEMHIYEKGKHGYGMAPDDPILSTWTNHCRDWLGMRGFLKKK